jgi:preprotein translocase subunit SecA
VGALLRAYSVFEKNVDYVVQDGKVMIVDEFTGRLMAGRRWSDGLHQAVEAKEGVKIERETQTLATITLQNYFRMYNKLAGMTGTAETEEDEFVQIYELPVRVIPPNEPLRRCDYDDLIFRTRREKFAAAIEEIERIHERKQPLLVGTVSVEVSEIISRLLKRKRIPHSVLNAKHHQSEAEIVVNAGQAGAVTIATNMAGRGTDIKLGEGVLRCEKCCLKCETKDCANCPNGHEDYTKQCLEDMPCGLRIIGTERHDSRRIDRQLRGRSGRQGDPGASQFFISLEDELMRLFGSERIAKVMTTLGVQEGEVIMHPMVTKAIGRAQKRVETHNFDIRKHLLDYDDVLNQQRQVIYAQRLNILSGGDLKDEISGIFDDVVGRIITAHTDTSHISEAWDFEGLNEEMRRMFLIDVDFSKADVTGITLDTLKANLNKAAALAYEHREEQVTPELMRRVERLVLLQVIDKHWRDHLYELDRLREGIGLRAYGQKNPLLEYKAEAFDLFMNMIESIQEESAQLLFRAQITAPPQPTSRVSDGRAHHPDAEVASHAATPSPTSTTPTPQFGAEAPGSTGRPSPGGLPLPPGRRPGTAARDGGSGARRDPVKKDKKVGRNDPCPCGSGKKYKKCCGRDA